MFDVAEKTIRKGIDIVSRRNRAKLAVNISETDFEKSCAPLLADARRAYVTSWDRVELVLGPRRLPGGSSVYWVANKDFGELELRTSPNFRTSFFVEIANFT